MSNTHRGTDDNDATIERLNVQHVVLRRLFRQRFGGDLYPDEDVLAREANAQHMNVGRVRGENREVVELAQPLYTWVVESMSIGALRVPME